MIKKVRVRFAPSPTGGLHLGGVRTALFNYLFAKQKGGDFVLRIEDTDQARFVDGAEEYIFDCLNWCGLEPDEGPVTGGKFSPYRQSERGPIYHEYAQQLVNEGKAYYAFDTQEELVHMRDRFKTEINTSPQYDHQLRMKMKNSLTLLPGAVESLLNDKTPYVIRIKLPENETISFVDMIRGEVHFNTNTVDDKVLLKADGMPTYHLAVVVDDYLMKISHSFRGEEWLPSAPVHILLWKYLGWEKYMPKWAHLPLILKPDGNGKLSKRDGDRLGFPVFAMNWTDPRTNELTKGFREMGFLPEAFLNILAMLGWNDGSGQEIFTKDELVNKFSIERVHKGGAKFDFEKAKWFNHEWIKRTTDESLSKELLRILKEKNIKADAYVVQQVVALVKERCTLLPDLWTTSYFFFEKPQQYDTVVLQQKWNEEKKRFFEEYIKKLETLTDFTATTLEPGFKELATSKNIKAGDVLLLFRIMLVGGKFGPGVFDIAALLGKKETVQRIHAALSQFQ